MQYMFIYLAISLHFLLIAPLNEYPECKHGGIRQTVEGRTSCECPRNRVNTGPLCEAVRVNFENLRNPLTILESVVLSLPLHISVEFISKDYWGTGGIFTLEDKQKYGLKIILGQKWGKPVIGLNGKTQTANVASLHDNQWHRLDLFLSKTPIGMEVVLIVDHCVKNWQCSQRLTFNGVHTPAYIDGALTLNMNSNEENRLQEFCLENIVIDSQLIDLWEATENHPEARGCPRCEDACYFSDAINATNKCGNEGVCRNPIVAATDQYVCTCRAGYQPVIVKDQYDGYKLNANSPCVQPTSEWLVNGPVSINLQNGYGFTLMLSLRTRQRNTAILRSRDKRIRLDLENGKLEFLVDSSTLALPGIEIADGMWHMIQLTVTKTITDARSRMVEIMVDGLWNTFYNASLLSAYSSNDPISDGILSIEAVSSCLSDVRLELRDSRNNVYHDYLINEHTETRQAFLERGCKSEDLCVLSNPCGPKEVCVSEWRGFRCECKPGYSRRLIPPAIAPICVLSSCTPNPCMNGGECFVLDNETLSGENETVAILCGCPNGWTGLFCERPPPAKAGLKNWWLIPVFFVLILIIFWIVFGVCWFKRKKLKKKNLAANIVNGPLFVEQQERMTPNGVAKAGEEDYRGSLNLNALKGPDVAIKPGHLTVRGASIETRNDDSMLLTEGEHFLAMDQPLQYAFEGYDSSPPPTYFFNNNRINGSDHYDFSKNTS